MIWGQTGNDRDGNQNRRSPVSTPGGPVLEFVPVKPLRTGFENEKAP